MSETLATGNEFLDTLNAVVAKNIANENFGVSELADEMNMSRSNLLRKVKKETGFSVAQLISQQRLERAMELLRTTSLNVSEVSHRVGFNSSSYFIKCFREFYGYPPGEVGKRDAGEIIVNHDDRLPAPEVQSKDRKIRWIAGSAILLLTCIIGIYFFTNRKEVDPAGKSIAVLPFKNESSDSTNVYLINGLMEATLNNLLQIKDVSVISRTTAEKYRSTTKSIPEMAQELGVEYFVEGSGQKIGDNILLNIQLIDAKTDKHLWAKQYRRQATDIFVLQEEIAKDIASEIKVIITPEIRERIEKKPTNDLVAYDQFLKGKELLFKGGKHELEAALTFFRDAIQRDPDFALAFANASIVYYYLDIFQVQKKYGAEINEYADKAMLYDPNASESLIAKALAFSHGEQYARAIPYFERALNYNLNQGLVLHFLTEFYSLYIPKPRKYLHYAIQKMKLDYRSPDSTLTSFNYFHVGNALLQTGFIDEAIHYLGRSLQYNPKSYFGGYVSIYAQYAKTNDLKHTRELLVRELAKDSSRFDIMQEIARVSFIMRDHETAYRYYQRFLKIQRAYHIDVYPQANLHIGKTYAYMGHEEEGKEFIGRYKVFAENNTTIYRPMLLAMYYADAGDVKKAIVLMKEFSKAEDVQFWTLLLPGDPLVDNIREEPEFKSAMKEIERRFWGAHKEIRKELEEQEFFEIRI